MFCSAIFAKPSNGGYTQTQESTTGGYTGDTKSRLVTIAQAKTMTDDRYVVLRGKIIQHLGKDKYILKDSTGEINIEIDDEKWRGISVGPDDTVEIQGELDRDWQHVEVDVDFINKTK